MLVAAHLEASISIASAHGFEALANRIAGLTYRPDIVEPAVPVPLVSDRLTVRCLGCFVIELDGRQLDLGALRPIHRELLGLLTSRPGIPIHREEIADAIWPNRSTDAARRGIHTAVSAIRSWLDVEGDASGRERIERIGDGYRIRLDPLHTDLGRLAARLRSVNREIRSGSCSIELLRVLVDDYSDEPFRSFGPVDWASHVRLATDATMRDILLAARCRTSTHADEWSLLWDRVTSVTGLDPDVHMFEVGGSVQ